MSSANRKISQLPESTEPASTAVVPVVTDAGSNAKVTLENAVKAGLPIAGTNQLGGVKIGSGITVAADGTISASGGGGDGGGASSLNDLNDVTITGNLTEGQVLVYSKNNLFENTNVLNSGQF